MHSRSNTNWLRVFSLAALAMIAIAAGTPAAHAQSTVGTITQLSGTANIQRAGATIAVAPNMPVMLHDRVITEANSSLTIGLVDNSSLQLGASSTLVIDESVLVNGVGAPSKVGLLGGKLNSVIVGAMKGSSPTFEVHTPNAIGAVRGTRFLFSFSNSPDPAYKDCVEFTDVDVETGTVQVCNDEKQCKKKQCEDLSAGKHLRIACCAFVGLSTLETAGIVAGGVGVAAGAGVGAAAGAGAFGGGTSPGCPNGMPGPPCGPKSPKH